MTIVQQPPVIDVNTLMSASIKTQNKKLIILPYAVAPKKIQMLTNHSFLTITSLAAVMSYHIHAGVQPLQPDTSYYSSAEPFMKTQFEPDLLLPPKPP